jgi:alpha-amylase/alpha-mannosidase (GH57 family)
VKRHLCIHGHFYQPPRENPWLSRIDRQDNAHPYHDWNARIDAECYGANARARILDHEDQVAAIVNNYARISFNFGPTLLSWLEASSPRTYVAILEADREAIRTLGHGAAMAQTYNHMIFPLASERDKQTQVVWGLADFRKRFGRAPKGMWLAETAVCSDSLRALARNGVEFTVLSPRQAAAVRPLGGATWDLVTESTVDTTTPYTIDRGGGLAITVFFYDGPLSQAVAFERLLANGGTFADRLVRSHPSRVGDHLIHIATDGETYGHHHRFGDMALAYALDRIDRSGDVKLTNYETYLATHPPTLEAKIHERTAWSCSHGVGRWETDCGCRTRADSSQAWRRPLREALDWLREGLDATFGAMTELFDDPWRARDRYVDVVLDRSSDNVGAFLDAHTLARTKEDRTRALIALEMQHHRMLMYTSCGWFFDDVDGLEPIQILRYAARALELHRRLDLLGAGLEEGFLARLSTARATTRGAPSAVDVYRRAVADARVDPKGFASTFAVLAAFGGAPPSSPALALVDREVTAQRTNGSRFAEGSVTVRDDLLLESHRFHFAVLGEGGSKLVGVVSERPLPKLGELYRDNDLEGVAERMRSLGISLTGIKGLPIDERALVVEEILSDAVREAEAAYRHVFTSNASLLAELAEVGVRPPRALSAATRVVLEADLLRALRRDPPDTRATRNVLAEALSENVTIDREAAAFELSLALARTATRLELDPLDDAELGRLGDLIAIGRRLGTQVDLSRTQDLTWMVVNEPSSRLARAVRDGGRLGAWRELAKLVRVRAT